MKSDKKKQQKEQLLALSDGGGARDAALLGMRKQLRTVAKVAAVAVLVVWLLAIGFWSGLGSTIPLYVAGALTVTMAVGAFLIRRNLAKSESLGAMLADGGSISSEERAARIAKLADAVAKGDATAIIARAQLEMHDAPRDALATLERVDLEKAQKMIAQQVRAMRATIHLTVGEVPKARELADAIALDKIPDLKSRASIAGVVAEAWARSGNPIEAAALLDKYDANDAEFRDVRLQLLRARAHACAHRNDVDGMRRTLKGLVELSPQLMTLFLGDKRVHPLLRQEARKKLEQSGMMPKQTIVGRAR